MVIDLGKPSHEKAHFLLGIAQIGGIPAQIYFDTFLTVISPIIQGCALFPSAKEKMHFSAEKFDDSPVCDSVCHNKSSTDLLTKFAKFQV